MSRGYKTVWLMPDHPFFTMGSQVKGKRGRQVAEHRFVMAKHLGRPLLSSEIVHHKR